MPGNIIAFLEAPRLSIMMHSAKKLVSLEGRKVATFPDAASLAASDIARQITTLVTTECSASLMKSLPGLRTIVNPIIGCENIDLDHAAARGITLRTGAIPENYEAMAEATIMLTLAALYDLPSSIRAMPDGERRPQTSQMLWRKTVGLVGFGNIGRAIARRLAGWSVNLKVTSRNRPDFGNIDASWVPLRSLLASSNVLIIACALTPETSNMIDAEQLALLPEGAIVINTARGGIVNEAALVTALQNGRLGAAALDVFENEPLPLDSKLHALDRVILTPHCVGHTLEGRNALQATLVNNILATST